jgi:hypothetical protein
MKVKTLLDLLKEVDPDRKVIMSKDSEGNSYSPLYSIWFGAYRPESTWGGEVGLEELTEEDIAHGYSEDDVISDGQSAVILQPTN